MTQEIGDQRDPHRRIGERLAEARDAAGMTIRQVSDRTRITPEVLRRVENGEFAECGGDVYARGHIRAYAQAVGLDPESLLGDYGAVRLPPLTRRDLRKPRVAPQPAKEAIGIPPRGARKSANQAARSILPTIVPGAMPSLVPMVGAVPEPDVPPLTHCRRVDFTDADAGSAATLVAGAHSAPARNERPAAFLAGAKTFAKSGPNWSLALAAALAAVGLAAAIQLWPDFSAHQARLASGAAAATPPHPAAPLPKHAVAAPPPSPTHQAAPVVVRIVAHNVPSWLGVTNAAGKQLYWNILQPGQTQEFTDDARIDVTLGDAGAVDLTVNGHDLSTHPTDGKVFHASYGPGPA